MNRRKQMLQELLARGPAESPVERKAPAAPEPPPGEAGGELGRRVPSGAVRAMGLDLARLTDEARRAQELERSIGDGQAVIEIDPACVDPSFAEDRIARTGDADYRRLVRSIAESGQQVPILVRPHPEAGDRYQAAYGHRRLSAAAELRIRVRAVVRPLSDAELVVAQGKENAERRNLSFIERVLFAADLEARGFGRSTLQAALAAHPADMTRYLAVARGIPRPLIKAIGPAPRAGRPRWMELAALLAASNGAAEAAAALAESPDFQAVSSDRRFEIVFSALRRRVTAAGPGPEGSPLAPIRGPEGEAVIKLERFATGARLTVLEQAAPGLSAFLLTRLPALVAEFREGGQVRRSRSDRAEDDQPSS